MYCTYVDGGDQIAATKRMGIIVPNCRNVAILHVEAGYS
jgi:hypothetical protein